MSLNIDVADIQTKNLCNTLIITGAPRSGTSLLGKLVSTLDHIDYHFEPPLVCTLITLVGMKALDPAVAAIILKTHLHEDLLVEAAHGRKANLRPNDDSLVLNGMSWQELLARWSNIKNRQDALELITTKQLRLSFKTPSSLDAIPFLNEHLPQSRFVVIMRRGSDVVRSIVQKRWFCDKKLEQNFWPYKILNGRKFPHFVEDSMAERWLHMNEVTRACYLWSRDADLALAEKSKNDTERSFFVFYEDLRRNPIETMENIAHFAKTKTTSLTEQAALTVRPPQSAHPCDFETAVEPDIFSRFKQINELWGYDLK